MPLLFAYDIRHVFSWPSSIIKRECRILQGEHDKEHFPSNMGSTPEVCMFLPGCQELEPRNKSDWSHLATCGHHTCEPLLMDMREIWFSFQRD